MGVDLLVGGCVGGWGWLMGFRGGYVHTYREDNPKANERTSRMVCRTWSRPTAVERTPRRFRRSGTLSECLGFGFVEAGWWWGFHFLSGRRSFITCSNRYRATHITQYAQPRTHDRRRDLHRLAPVEGVHQAPNPRAVDGRGRRGCRVGGWGRWAREQVEDAFDVVRGLCMCICELMCLSCVLLGRGTWTAKAHRCKSIDPKKPHALGCPSRGSWSGRRLASFAARPRPSCGGGCRSVFVLCV